MKIYLLTEERADDNGIHFDSVPYSSMDEAVKEMSARVKKFKDDIVREFVKDEFVDEEKPDSHYCTASWTMHLYDYCKVKVFEVF